VRDCNGFTLIELLVVVAILALLIAIIIPALSKSKDHARRLVCATNQGTVAKAVYVYVEEFDTKLPTSCYSGGVGDYEMAYSYYPWSGYVACTIDTSQVFGSHITEGPWGVGLLFQTDIVDEPRSFYCPAMPKRSRSAIVVNDYAYTYEAHTDHAGRWPWNTNEWATLWVSVSYYYNPFSKDKNELDVPAIAVKSADLQHASIMGFDIILDIGYMPHKIQKASGGGVNAFYGDGHVEFRNSPEAFNYIFDTANWTSSMDSFNHHPEMFAEFLRKL
jgi:prepilin-type N-terminal cleavage/methylation domain-containing protein/prepilin-type processing-associated H-X9-DG protein